MTDKHNFIVNPETVTPEQLISEWSLPLDRAALLGDAATELRATLERIERVRLLMGEATAELRKIVTGMGNASMLQHVNATLTAAQVGGVNIVSHEENGNRGKAILAALDRTANTKMSTARAQLTHAHQSGAEAIEQLRSSVSGLDPFVSAVTAVLASVDGAFDATIGIEEGARYLGLTTQPRVPYPAVTEQPTP